MQIIVCYADLMYANVTQIVPFQFQSMDTKMWVKNLIIARVPLGENVSNALSS